MQGNSRGYLYHDDFHSPAYQQGDYVLCEITMQSATTLSSRQVLCTRDTEAAEWGARMWMQ